MVEGTNQNEVTPATNPHSVAVTKVETMPVLNSNDIAISRVNLLDESQVAKAEIILKRLMRSDKGGVKSIEDGLAMIMRAQDLNVPFSTAVEHIHIINGKTGVDIHIIKSLLSKAGVTWGEPFMDYAPLYEYTDGINIYVDGSFPDYAVRCKSAKEAKTLEDANKAKEEPEDKIYIYPVRFYQDFNGNIYREYQLNANFVVVNNKAQIAKVAAEKKIPIYRIPNKPVDFVTKYRLFRTINGKETTSVGSFSYLEAVAAGMFEKDTYKKYPKILIGHRAFTYAARDIASDVLLGVMETTELKQWANVDIQDADVVDIQ